MADIASDTVVASCYPPEQLYLCWCEHASELDMSTSQFLIRMVEAGRKDISANSFSSNTIQELRQQLTDLREELKHQRERNQDLERQLQYTVQAEIVTYIEENCGVTTPQVVQHIADTVPGRVASHLDTLEGNAIENQGDGYYPIDPDE